MEKEHNTKLEKTASYECGICGNKFTESRNVIRHLKKVHGCQTYTKCKHCTQIYGDNSSCARHEEDVHGTHTEVSEKIESSLELQEKQAIGKFFQSFRIHAFNVVTELLVHLCYGSFTFVTEHLEDLKLFVRNKIAELGPLKIQLPVFV